MQDLKKLKVGKQYTIFGFHLQGYPYKVHFTLKEIHLTPYGQFAESFLLVFRVPGSRRPATIRITPDRLFAVWENFVEVNTEVVRDWTPFDRRYFQRAFSGVPAAPIAEHTESPAIKL